MTNIKDKARKRAILRVLIALIIAILIIELFTGFFVWIAKEEKKKIFASKCVSYHDGCNYVSVPKTPDEPIYSSLKYCPKLQSLPFGIIRSDLHGWPKCTTIEGMSMEETAEYLKSHPLPKYKINNQKSK